MKLLHVIGRFDVEAGGTYTAVLSLVNMFRELGHTNHIIATTEKAGFPAADITAAELIFFERSFPKMFRKSRKAKEWVSENIQNYDAVLVHEIWGGIGIDACLIAMQKGITYYIWPHGSLDPFDLKKKQILKEIVGRFVVSRILRKAKYICCTSIKEQEVINFFGKRNGNVIVLPLPVDFCVSDEIADPDPRLLSKVLPADAFVFLFFSRINYKKGLDLFLRAFAESLLEQKISSRSYLCIAGTGSIEYERYIDALIQELKLEAHVVKLGFVTGDRRLDVYRNAHVFVLPSKNENFGLSVVEALQSGTPVLISNNIYIHQELFDGEKPGWVCQYDIADVKQKLIEAAQVTMENRISAKQVGSRYETAELLNVYRQYF